jgi:hypothetical protein
VAIEKRLHPHRRVIARAGVDQKVRADIVAGRERYGRADVRITKSIEFKRQRGDAARRPKRLRVVNPEPRGTVIEFDNVILQEPETKYAVHVRDDGALIAKQDRHVGEREASHLDVDATHALIPDDVRTDASACAGGIRLQSGGLGLRLVQGQHPAAT